MASDTAPAGSITDRAADLDPVASEAPRPRMPAGISDDVLDIVFRQARTPSRWSDAPVPQSVLHALYDLVKLGPTSGNCSPARLVFLESRDSRERLRPALSIGNVDATLAAPVTVIVAQDPLFYEQLPRLYPRAEARSWFAADLGLADETAFRNATLQGGYLILAARLLGLAAWPMSGFDAAKVDEMFLSGQGWRSNFLINLGYADGLPDTPRAPRLTFDEACLLL